MARSMRASPLETRSARLKLAVRKKPYWARIGHGAGLGYRRNQGPGTWVLRVSGAGGYTTKTVATADDYDAADDGAVLDFWQAQARARSLALAARHGGGGKLCTVAEAVTAYEENLKARGGDAANAERVSIHLPDALAGKTVALLAAQDFKPWRSALTEAKLSPATVNRTNTCLRAALNIAADQDERITSRRAWEKALAALPGATESRNVILQEPAVRAVIASAYEKISPEFGLLVEAAAVTGARVSQLARLEVQDLQADRADPRLMVPPSRKGRGRRSAERRPVPIPAGLAARLAAAARGRAADAPLLVKPSGGRWQPSEHGRPFGRAVKRAGAAAAEPAGITIYALRHTSIVRQLLANVPVRVVAVNHDTSVAMIERTYSKFIADHSDAVSRRALIDLDEPAGEKVTPIRGRR
jgi:integrase